MHPIPQKTTSPQMLYYRSDNPCFIHLGMYIFLSFGVGMLLIFIFRCIILFIFCPLTSRSCCLISCRLGNLCKGSCLLVFLMLSAKWRVNSVVVYRVYLIISMFATIHPDLPHFCLLYGERIRQIIQYFKISIKICKLLVIYFWVSVLLQSLKFYSFVLFIISGTRTISSLGHDV